MEKFQVGPPTDARAELLHLLVHNGFAFREQDGRFQLVFSDSGCKWQTECVCREQTVLFYSSFPFVIRDGPAFDQQCREINRQAVFGALLRVGDRAVYRTAAALPDAFSAYEQLGRMLEYNAGMMVRFWNTVAACAQPQPLSHMDMRDSTSCVL
ncbi:MAG: hypothetical protein ACI4LE_04535 [Faecalibacterium sp.]